MPPSDNEEYSALLNWGLRLTFLLALPAAVGMATLAEPLIATLFHYGKFSTAATIHASALPLMAYSAGLVGIILVKTLAPAFYARQDIRTPVRIAARRAGGDAADEPGVRAAPGGGRPGAVDRPGRLPERAVPVQRPAAPQDLRAAAGLGRLFRASWWWRCA